MIRAAQPTDGEQITRVFLNARHVSMPWLPVMHSDEETRSWVDQVIIPNLRVWVAQSEGVESEGEVLAFAALDGDWLEHFYVAPSAQGRGLGSKLLNVVLDACGSTVWLHVFEQNWQARSFYEHRGFVLTERSDGCSDGPSNEENLPDVTYSWSRPAPS